MLKIRMAAPWLFCCGFLLENVQGPKLYKSTKFHAFMKKLILFFNNLNLLLVTTFIKNVVE